jgi:GAF domain-containing protein
MRTSDEPSGSDLRVAGDASTELLVEAGMVLARSLEPDVTMREVARLTVPRLADLCVIDLRGDDGDIRGVAVVARDEGLEHGLAELRNRFPLDPAGDHPVARVLRSGDSELLEEMPEQMLRSFARSPSHARFMVAHAYRSAIVAPLVARGRTFGALSVLRLGEREPFAEADRQLVDELARRAALAIDNARLFSELRLLERRMEAILAGVAEAITVVDADGRTVFANAAAAELLRVVSPAELVLRAPGEIMRRFLVLDEEGCELELAEMPGRRLLRGDSAPPPLLVRNIVRETGEERWLVVRASPVIDTDSGRLTHVVNLFENVTELKRAELAERFLADASRILVSSVPTARGLDQVARMAIERIADWCAVYLTDDRGEIRRVATRAAQSSAIHIGIGGSPRRDEVKLDDRDGVATIVRAGHTRVWPADAGAADTAPSEHVDVLRLAGAEAVIVAPIMSGRSPYGAVTLARSQPGRRFSSADVSLVQELGLRIGTAVVNARRFTERSRIAHTLQQALLPESLPHSDAFEVHAVYEPAGELNEVGGDFYDVLDCDGHWLVAVGDVCGKGADAAGLTALARHTLRAAGISGQTPAQMLGTLHQALLRRPQRIEPCTACVVLVRPDDGRARLTVALAGHYPPLLVGADGEAAPVGRAGTLLGAVDPIEVHEVDGELHAGETLLLYTDGVIDAGRPYRALGERGLADLCARAPGRTLEDLLEYIRAETLGHGGGSLRDDVTMLALRLRANG